MKFTKQFWCHATVILSCAMLCRSAFAEANELAPTSSFERFFIAGGPLVYVLLVLSLLTAKLIVQYFLVIRRKKMLPVRLVNRIESLLAEDRVESALDFLEKDDSFLARTVQNGLAEAGNGRAAMDNAIAEMLEQQTTGLMRRIEWLNIIGNVAPMIGLFGTVWGMINAFNGIVQAGGQPEPADLAGGISVALVTTWWGLLVAIPALAAFGILRNRIDALAAETALTTESLLRNIHLANLPLNIP